MGGGEAAEQFGRAPEEAKRSERGIAMTENGLMTAAKGLALQSLDDALTFGKIVAESQFAPKEFRGKPADCVLAIQHGAEIGLSPMQALQSICVVNGKPSIYGDAAKAVCLGSAVCEYVTETIDGDGDAMVATCTAKRRGHPEPVVFSFSVADAKRADLWGKGGPWKQYPRRMLQLRARGFALRDAFPDVLRGLITSEEAADYPQPVEVKSERKKKAEPARIGVAEKPRDFRVDEIGSWPDDVKAVCREAMKAARAAGASDDESIAKAHAAGLAIIEETRAEAAAAEGN
jgi:hypothetical protein